MDPRLVEALRQFQTGGDSAQLDLIYDLLRQSDESDRLTPGWDDASKGQDKLFPAEQLADQLAPGLPPKARGAGSDFASQASQGQDKLFPADQLLPIPREQRNAAAIASHAAAGGMVPGAPAAGLDAFGLSTAPPPAPATARTISPPKIPFDMLKTNEFEIPYDILQTDDPSQASIDQTLAEAMKARVAKDADAEFAHLTKRDPAAEKADRARAMTDPRRAANMQRRWNAVTSQIEDIRRAGGQVPPELLADQKYYASFLSENAKTRALMDSGGTRGEIDRIRSKARRRGKSLFEVLGDPAVKAARDKIMKDGDETRLRPGSDIGYNPETNVLVDLKSKHRRPVDKVRHDMAVAGKIDAEERLLREGSTPEKRAKQRRKTMSFRSVMNELGEMGFEAGLTGTDLPEITAKYLRTEFGLKGLSAVRLRALQRKARLQRRKGAAKGRVRLQKEREKFHRRGMTHPADRREIDLGDDLDLEDLPAGAPPGVDMTKPPVVNVPNVPLEDTFGDRDDDENKQKRGPGAQ